MAGGDSRHRGGGEADPVGGRQNSENEKQQTTLRPQSKQKLKSHSPSTDSEEQQGSPPAAGYFA